jgi:hypothetical protein
MYNREHGGEIMQIIELPIEYELNGQIDITNLVSGLFMN